MNLPPLPHVFPFRFVERIRSRLSVNGEGTVRAVVSANAFAQQALPLLPLPVAVEMMAQAALLLQGGDPEIGRKGFLAAVDRVRLTGAIRPGDELEIRIRIAGRFGPMVRFSAHMTQGSRAVGRAEITVKTGN